MNILCLFIHTTWQRKKQTGRLRLAVLAARVLTECMPTEVLLVCLYIGISLFARHQSELSAPLPCMEIDGAKVCHTVPPSARHHLFLTHK